ncbi:hypothetical protein ACFSL4_26605 [Streptomyces caeni]|uniref:Uncharacterized protein n=1 Tax=Streptomyces caeni TaxID=2307231 RepID=A0ABW4IYH4_9ACTN
MERPLAGVRMWWGVLWFVGLLLSPQVGEYGDTVYFWGSAAVGGMYLWSKYETKQQEAAQDEKREKEARRRDADALKMAQRGQKARAWLGELAKEHPEQDESHRPPPASVVPADSLPRLLYVRDGRGPSSVLLPRLDVATYACAAALSGLVRFVAAEAVEHAAALSLPAHGCTQSRYREADEPQLGEWSDLREGSRPLPETAERLYTVLAWLTGRTTVLAHLYPPAEKKLARLNAYQRQLREWRKSSRYASKPPGPPTRPPGQWEKYLNGLCDDLRALAAELTTLSVPPPERRPALSHAILREDSASEVVAAEIQAQIHTVAACFARQAADPAQTARPFPGFDLHLLDGFRTAEVRNRYLTALQACTDVEAVGDALVPELGHLLHYAHAALVLDYLLEVHTRMPDYARASGEGGPEPRFNISDSVVQIANTLTNINSTIAKVIERREPEQAEALEALTAAVQAEQNLSPEQRGTLLDHVADMAEGMAAPGQGRNRSRGAAALAAITQAAAASGQIATVVREWADVFHRAF